MMFNEHEMSASEAVSENWMRRLVDPSVAGETPREPSPSAPTPIPEAPAAARAPEPPLYPRIPDYEIVGQLGSGGMGVVYKARCTRLHESEIVAVKFMRAEMIREETAEKRFWNEVRILQRLQHPDIVRLHSAGKYDGCPYFVMDFVGDESGASKTLAHLIRADVVPQFEQSADVAKRAPKKLEANRSRRICAIVERIALAIQAAHEQDVIHRDLKPENVLLAANGWPKITDFGVAKTVADDEGRTATGESLGTVTYMAPEQARGESKLTEAVDVYALGGILFAMLTGTPPYRGENNDQTRAALLAAKEPPSPLERIKAIAASRGLPLEKFVSRGDLRAYTALDAVCRKCLEPEPQKRYRTARAVAEELDRIYYNNRQLERVTDTMRRGARWLLAQRKRWMWAALILVASCVLGLCIKVGTRQEKEIKRYESSEVPRLKETTAQTKQELNDTQDDLLEANIELTLARADLADEQFRTGALEKELRDSKLALAEARQQLARVPVHPVAPNGKLGPVVLELRWSDRNDLDLHCIDPNGEELFYSNPKAKKGSGGYLDVDRNRRGESNEPVETITYPAGAPAGEYKVFVRYYANKGDSEPTKYTLTVRVREQTFTVSGVITQDEREKRPLGAFTLK